MTLGEAPAADVRSESLVGTPAHAASQHIPFALVALAAFGLYWLSSFVLAARGGVETWLFGADTPVYIELAKENVIDRIGADRYLDRITRFHPATTAAAVAWMTILSPLTVWIAPAHQLKAMFAAVGAVGVWAAIWAFAAVVPHRHAMLWGTIYATSLGVWYFSSIEESKIVSATLTALYIAAYLHLRKNWTMRGAVLLTAILLVACLNEIIAGFLVVIPVVDTLLQRGWDLRHGWWIGLHGLAAPIALVFLEGVVNGHWVAAGTDPEGGSHVRMLMFYVANHGFSIETLYSFLVDWLFFNIAAPTPSTSYVYPHWPYSKYFEPVLTNYFSSPVSAGLVVLFGAMLVASVLPRYRGKGTGCLTGILPALLAYALLRGTFFFIFNPFEGLLYSSSVTLAHMLLIGIPFTASTFPAKQWLLAAFALLLFISNGAFIIGPWPLPPWP